MIVLLDEFWNGPTSRCFQNLEGVGRCHSALCHVLKEIKEREPSEAPTDFQLTFRLLSKMDSQYNEEPGWEEIYGSFWYNDDMTTELVIERVAAFERWKQRRGEADREKQAAERRG